MTDEYRRSRLPLTSPQNFPSSLSAVLGSTSGAVANFATCTLPIEPEGGYAEANKHTPWAFSVG